MPRTPTNLYSVPKLRAARGTVQHDLRYCSSSIISCDSLTINSKTKTNMMHILSFLLVANCLVGGLVVPTSAEQDLASFRLLTPAEQEQALVLIISKAEGSSYETVGLESGTLETMPAMITIHNFASTPPITTSFPLA